MYMYMYMYRCCEYVYMYMHFLVLALYPRSGRGLLYAHVCDLFHNRSYSRVDHINRIGSYSHEQCMYIHVYMYM